MLKNIKHLFQLYTKKFTRKISCSLKFKPWIAHALCVEGRNSLCSIEPDWNAASTPLSPQAENFGDNRGCKIFAIFRCFRVFQETYAWKRDYDFLNYFLLNFLEQFFKISLKNSKPAPSAPWILFRALCVWKKGSCPPPLGPKKCASNTAPVPWEGGRDWIRSREQPWTSLYVSMLVCTYICIFPTSS